MSVEQAVALIKTDKLTEASSTLQQHLQTKPDDRWALYLLGQTLAKLKQWQPAIEVLSKVLAKELANIQAMYCLGYCYEMTESYAQATELYKKVIKLDKNHWQAYYHMALIMLVDNQEILAERYAEKTLQLCGPHYEVYNVLAEANKRIGIYDKANHYSREAYKLAPNKDLLGVIVYMMHFDPNQGLKDFWYWTTQYHDNYLAHLQPAYDFSKRKPKQKIRLGFVSADFRAHPIASYLIRIFEKLNKDEFEIYLYYNKDDIRDQTKIMQELADEFHFVKEMADQELADLIYQDEVDILFDMSGFTAGERLPVFKLKPAPVQITHQGYFGTLAIPEIDYIIGDEIIIKPGEEKYFSEEVIRLKSFAHAALYGNFEPTAKPPCLDNGYITFGALNSMRKISPEVLETWIEIMRAVPESRIQFDCKVLVIDTNKEHFFEIFERGGISRDRVLIDATVERQDFLAKFNEVDIMLDPFPYGGGTTSLEATMMGVPIVTIEGDRWVGRMTASYYHNLNREELIAQSRRDYIAKAIELANDTERIATYKASLPGQLKDSPLSIESFVADFEEQMKKLV